MQEIDSTSVLWQWDYHSFGMGMPGRTWQVGDENYRFGFNRNENDDEVYGNNNLQDYGFRINNPRLGRFLSVDPIFKEYPELTPYQFASNNPIEGVDRDGLEIQEVNSSMYRMRYLGSDPFLVASNSEFVVDQVNDNIPKGYISPPRRMTGAFSHDEMYKGVVLLKNGHVIPAIDDGSDPMRPGVIVDPKGKIPYTGYVISTSGVKFNAIMATIETLRASAEYYFIQKPIYDGNEKEYNDRTAFYEATRIVDYITNETDYFNKYNGSEFKSGQGRADLINFINDGTLPTIDIYNASQRDLDKHLDYSNKIKSFGEALLRANEYPVREEQISNADK